MAKRGSLGRGELFAFLRDSEQPVAHDVQLGESARGLFIKDVRAHCVHIDLPITPNVTVSPVFVA
jgi:hypothetical protein